MSVTALTAEPTMPWSWYSGGLNSGRRAARTEQRIVLRHRWCWLPDRPERSGLAVTDDDEVDDVAGLEAAHGLAEFDRGRDRDAADRHDLVVGTDARLPGRQLLRCGADDHAGSSCAVISP
jgi:hypothetical protein